MNHAYVDASWQEISPEHGRGGWGLVLLGNAALPLRVGGFMEASDNNAAEMRAVLEAVRRAPAGEALSLHSDNQAVLSALGKGGGPSSLWVMRQGVLELAQERSIALRAQYEARTRRHMRSAHDLANVARTTGLTVHPSPRTEIILDLRGLPSQARILLRRQGERLSFSVGLDPLDQLPPSTQALLTAIHLAETGEILAVRGAPKLARALWDNPIRTLHEGAQARLLAAKAWAAAQGVEVIFE